MIKSALYTKDQNSGDEYESTSPRSSPFVVRKSFKEPYDEDSFHLVNGSSNDENESPNFGKSSGFKMKSTTAKENIQLWNLMYRRIEKQSDLLNDLKTETKLLKESNQSVRDGQKQQTLISRPNSPSVTRMDLKKNTSKKEVHILPIDNDRLEKNVKKENEISDEDKVQLKKENLELKKEISNLKTALKEKTISVLYFNNLLYEKKKIEKEIREKETALSKENEKLKSLSLKNLELAQTKCQEYEEGKETQLRLVNDNEDLEKNLLQLTNENQKLKELNNGWTKENQKLQRSNENQLQEKDIALCYAKNVIYSKKTTEKKQMEKENRLESEIKRFRSFQVLQQQNIQKERLEKESELKERNLQNQALEEEKIELQKTLEEKEKINQKNEKELNEKTFIIDVLEKAQMENLQVLEEKEKELAAMKLTIEALEKDRIEDLQVLEEKELIIQAYETDQLDIETRLKEKTLLICAFEKTQMEILQVLEEKEKDLAKNNLKIEALENNRVEMLQVLEQREMAIQNYKSDRLDKETKLNEKTLLISTLEKIQLENLQALEEKEKELAKDNLKMEALGKNHAEALQVLEEKKLAIQNYEKDRLETDKKLKGAIEKIEKLEKNQLETLECLKDKEMEISALIDNEKSWSKKKSEFLDWQEKLTEQLIAPEAALEPHFDCIKSLAMQFIQQQWQDLSESQSGGLPEHSTEDLLLLKEKELQAHMNNIKCLAQKFVVDEKDHLQQKQEQQLEHLSLKCPTYTPSSFGFIRSEIMDDFKPQKCQSLEALEEELKTHLSNIKSLAQKLVVDEHQCNLQHQLEQGLEFSLHPLESQYSELQLSECLTEESLIEQEEEFKAHLHSIQSLANLLSTSH